MSRRSLSLAAALVLSTVIPLHGQSIVVGDIPAVSNFTTAPHDTPITVIDMSHPANADGTLTTATLRWTGNAACTSAFTVRIFRSIGTIDTLSLVAERGPFGVPANGGLVIVDLSPPVSIARGDLIGVTIPTGCGGVSGAYGDARDFQIVVPSDYSGGPLGSAQLNRASRVALRASSPPATLVGIVPVVGATAGAFGAQFRTTIQVTNPSAETITVTFVYHATGQMGTSNDPAVAVSLAANATTTVELLDALHLTGVGSADVYTTGAAPLVTARVYNDTGSGTSGFTETMFAPNAALRNAQRANLVFPSDLVNFRMNVGIRTLDNGATVTGTVYDSAGKSIGTITKIYPGNFFEQVSLQAFLGSPPASQGGSVDFQVVAGDAFVYASSTDNRTNDSAIFFPRYR